MGAGVSVDVSMAIAVDVWHGKDVEGDPPRQSVFPM